MSANQDNILPLYDSVTPWNIGHVVRELRSVRTRWREPQGRNRESGGRELPSREALNDCEISLRCAVPHAPGATGSASGK
jgi:serine O-acetyltransferase